MGSGGSCVLPACFLCPCEATSAGAVTLTSLSYIVFWSVTILVPEVLVCLVFCCEGCRVPFLLFLVPFRASGTGPAPARPGNIRGTPGFVYLVNCVQSLPVGAGAGGQKGHPEGSELGAGGIY